MTRGEKAGAFVAAFLFVLAAVFAVVLYGDLFTDGGASSMPAEPPLRPAIDAPVTTSTTEEPVTTSTTAVPVEIPQVQQNAPAPRQPSATCGDGYVISGEVVWRESRCDPNAFNATGCGGRGCIGLYQEDLGHFAAVSPWNSNVSGSCYGLNPQSQADQAECATRLGPGAWG